LSTFLVDFEDVASCLLDAELHIECRNICFLLDVLSEKERKKIYTFSRF
jgi:hypothetical protein